MKTTGPQIHSQFRSAFTLVEMMIVAGVIVLMLALAVPAYRTISGSRSIEMATNQISAMIGRARNTAVDRGSHVGMLLFRDPVRDRVGMQLVEVSKVNFHGPEAYQAWTPGVNYKAAHGDVDADRVYCLVQDPTEINQTKYVVRTYICINDIVSSSTVPSLNGTSDAVPSPAGSDNVNWVFVPNSDVEAMDDGVQYLPPGVGAQLINDPHGDPSMDKYLQTGMIIFDEQGKFISEAFSISSSSAVGKELQLNGTLDFARSQIGLVLYDHQLLANMPKYSPGDLKVSLPALQGPATPTDELDATVTAATLSTTPETQWPEENWIELKATHMLVDRNTGNLMKVE